jgi:hypothetical protein
LKTVNIDNRNINWYSYCGKQFDHSSKAWTWNFHKTPPLHSQVYGQKNSKAKAEIDMGIALFIQCIIHDSLNEETTQVSIHKWQMCYTQTTEHYFIIKGMELSHTTMWMNNKNIMLCELNQSPKDKYYVIVWDM